MQQALRCFIMYLSRTLYGSTAYHTPALCCGSRGGLWVKRLATHVSNFTRVTYACVTRGRSASCRVCACA